MKSSRSAEALGKYSIRLAARMTGIPADTLRVWERRYGAPKPSRTPGGGRAYSDADIALLRVVARAIEKGYRPQELLGRSHAELEELLRAVGASPTTPPESRTALQAPSRAAAVDAIKAEDPRRLREELRRAALTLGPKAFVVEYAAPLLTQIGNLWAEGSIAVRHEHLASEALATQLRVLLAAYEDLHRAPVVVLTTLPDEPHSLGILLVALYTAVGGAAPRLLGPSTPIEEIREAARSLSADVVGITVTGVNEPEAVEKEIDELRQRLPKSVALWVGGSGAAGLSLPDATLRTRTWDEVDRALAAAR